MGAPATAPVLVYDRIAANRRATWLLLFLSAVLLLPLALPATEYLALWAIMLLGPLVSNFWAAMTAGALALITTVALAYGYAAKLALRMSGAHQVAPGEEEAVRRSVENLGIGSGLPQPAIYLMETPALNAFSIGLNPWRSTLVLTRGLVSRLEPRELEAVIAHEMAHIGNHDTRLGTVLAAMVSVLWLPARILRGIFAVLFPLHPAIWAAGLLWCGYMLSFAVDGWMWLISDSFTKGEWIWLALGAASAYFTVGSPCVAVLLRRWIWSQREMLADADAVLLTRNPTALEHALEKIAPKSAMRVNPGTAHLYIADPLAGSTSLADRLFSSHPRIIDRLTMLQRMGSGLVEKPAAQLGREVRLLDILVAVETWPRRTWAALALLVLPTMLMLAGGIGVLYVLDRLVTLGFWGVALWVALRWSASRAILYRLLDGPLFAATPEQNNPAADGSADVG